jgi:hypothetical protein
MKTEEQLITPEMAKDYLTRNTRNRKLRKSVVEQYARDMRHGRWLLTHQGIAFNCDGTLLDGQHRLEAIILSQTSVWMNVSRGVASESQIAMDDHAKRTAANAIGLVKNIALSDKQIGVIRAVVELGSSMDRNKGRTTKQELGDLVKVFEKPLRFLDEWFPVSERGITSAPVQSAIALAWFYVSDMERLRFFCDVLSGRSLAENSGDKAAVTLREWLLKTGMKHNATRIEGFKKTQRAIVGFLERKELGKLYGTSTYYPWPLVEPVRQ